MVNGTSHVIHFCAAIVQHDGIRGSYRSPGVISRVSLPTPRVNYQYTCCELTSVASQSYREHTCVALPSTRSRCYFSSVATYVPCRSVYINHRFDLEKQNLISINISTITTKTNTVERPTAARDTTSRNLHTFFHQSP